MDPTRRLQLSKDQASEARRTAKEDAEFIDAMKQLVAFPPFKLYQEKVYRLVEDRGSEALLEPAGDGVLHVLRSEHAKGTINGLLLAMNLPDVTIQQHESARDAQDAPYEYD